MEKAASMELHKQRAWHALMHYRPSLIRGYESVVDDPDFFFSPRGKHDPGEELRETIRSFFQTEPMDDSHPRCRFPARYAWLKETLGIDESALPGPECAELREFIEGAAPRSAVLVFPEAHMNSPASMFGHTLIRIDSARESKLVSPAVNYSAVTNEDFGPLYALKGIFGQYKGYFSVLPYYEKINDYSDMENRDIWEYGMDLSEKEVLMLALHTWEMKDIHSDYYFFTDNCSYVLLFLIEAARPELRTTEGFFYWVTPVDTIRELDRSGLLSTPVFRPSKATRLKHMAGLADRKYRQTAKKIARNETTPRELLEDRNASNEDRIRTLDMASEYVQYMYIGTELEKEEYTKRFLEILGARSSLGKLDYDIPTPARPDHGHGSSRAALGAGVHDGRVYQLLRFRTAYHDLLDPDDGYKQGAAISFFDFEFRHLYSEEKTVMHVLSMVDITSISPVDTFFHNVSWKVSARFQREEPEEGAYRTVFALNTGGGFAFSTFGDGAIYVLLEPAVKAGGGLIKGYSLGMGVSAGLLLPIAKTYKAHAAVTGVSYEMGDEHREYSVELGQRLSLSRNNALKLHMSRMRTDGHYSTDISLGWNFYF